MSRALSVVFLAVLLTAALSASAQHNALTITSQPGNAAVYLDDVPKGTTSPDNGTLVLENVSGGSHKLRLSASGYQDWVQTVTVADGSDLSVEAKLLLTAVYRIGDGVSAPRAIYSPDPEYSEEARKARYQGVVVLYMVVGADGKPHDIRIQSLLGLGLDEKAIEAVRTWKFEPARKDGQSVNVQVNVEVKFRIDGASCSGSVGPLCLRLFDNALKAGVPTEELTNLVKKKGVDFTLDKKAEKRLREKGADDALLQAIATNRK